MDRRNTRDDHATLLYHSISLTDDSIAQAPLLAIKHQGGSSDRCDRRSTVRSARADTRSHREEGAQGLDRIPMRHRGRSVEDAQSPSKCPATSRSAQLLLQCTPNTSAGTGTGDLEQRRAKRGKAVLDLCLPCWADVTTIQAS